VRRIREIWGECRARLSDWWRRLLSVFDGVAMALVRWPNEIFGRVEIRSAKAGAVVGGSIARWLIDRLQIVRGFRLFMYWWVTRRWSVLLRGLPALAVAVAVAVVVVIVARDSAGRQTYRYQLEAQLAWERGDTERTKLCLQRLALLNPAEPAHVWGLAQSEGRLGHANRALALMQSIAPAERPGFAPAHLWQARQLMWRGHLSSEQLQLAERHLLACLEVQPQAAEADALLGQLYLARGQTDEAETHLKRVTAYGEPLLVLARLHASQGKTAEAHAEAAVALRFFKARAEADPKNIALRLHWAEATALLDQFPAAIEILHAGSQESSVPAYRLALSQTYDRWAAAPGMQGSAKLGFRLLLVQQALRYDHGNPDALRRLLALSQSQEPETAATWDEFRRRLAADPKSAGLNLIVGIGHLGRREHEHARRYFATAAQLDRSIAPLLNNLAWIRSHSDPTDAAQALPLIEAALQLEPANAHYRDTRGHVLARLGRWPDAVADLEVATVGLPKSARREELIAEAHRHLGQD